MHDLFNTFIQLHLGMLMNHLNVRIHANHIISVFFFILFWVLLLIFTSNSGIHTIFIHYVEFYQLKLKEKKRNEEKNENRLITFAFFVWHS